MSIKPIRTMSKSNEWNTPKVYVEAARCLMGDIELDPASSEKANQVVRAQRYYTMEEDGLAQSWEARTVWCNPPYGRNECGQSNQDIWSAKLIAEYEAGHVQEAVLLVNAATDTDWFQRFHFYRLPICLTDHRIAFWRCETAGESTIGSAFIYFGNQIDNFVTHFVQFSRSGGIVRSIVPPVKTLWG